MSKGDYKYGPSLGFCQQSMPPKRKTSVIYDDDVKKVNNRVIKKVKVTVPGLGAEKIFISAKDCAKALCIDTALLYTYIRKGWAGRGMIRFEYVE